MLVNGVQVLLCLAHYLQQVFSGRAAEVLKYATGAFLRPFWEVTGLTYLIANALELLGLFSGLLCVWLLIRQNVLTFPIGLIYAIVTVVVVARADLFADVLLNVYYVLMNAYGWYFWVYGGAGAPPHAGIVCCLDAHLAALGACRVDCCRHGGNGAFFSSQTSASLPYPDSFTTVASFAARWMSARKYLESWILWFVIDVVQVVLYLIKGIEAYALLYLVYLVMAFYGWKSWRVTMKQHPPAVS